ncbi:Hypothetical Protein FCC1311_026452 [Hondaea fermentalgiana]|uniref:Uncharacterized protein n=1 Tax=Hondaea fermentalgiana TaxID=2315210 RepID=A0A2R5GF16_9STRA|nr:Hypothetical Protein FCC1311_026452 [Hondaea fermentalgiana]|eukprot:GBG26424.1 Hypothetical Protein FCC1311_026452 [Hondaea fermentalgiana]
MAGLDEDVRDEAVLHSLRRRLCRVLGPKAVGDEERLADILHRIADGKVAGPGLTPHQTAQEVIRALASIAGAVRALQDQSNEEENEACPRQHREIRCDAAKVSRRATIDASELDKLRELYSQVDREPLAVVSQETTSA